MADAKEAPDITPEDTSVSDEVDTSTDEFEDPIDSLEESDISFDDVEDDDSDNTESSESKDSSESTEEESTEDSDEEEQPEEDVAEEESVEDTEEAEAKEEDTTSDEQTEEETPKKGEPDPELAREAFKRREAERKLREAQQQREDENLDRYLKEAEGDEAELAKRQMEVQTHKLNKERSSVLQDKLDVGIQRAVGELGLDKADKAVLDKLGRELDKFEQGNVVKDRNGNIVEVKGDVYQYIKEEMDFISQFQNVGAREQAKSKAKEKSRTVITPTRTPKEKAVDQDLLDFDSAFYGEDE